jgi:putative heme-binding domain-containing protein
MAILRETMLAVAAAWALAAALPADLDLAGRGLPPSLKLRPTSQASPSPPGDQNETLAGDAGRGKALIESSGCFDCHRIDDRGSRLGPNLSSIGSRRTPVRLRQALLAPDEEVVPDNRFVRIVTKDGTTVTGKLLNQDAISVQMMNPKEELKTYLRANIREYTIIDKGLMPPVEGKLNAQQVADIVSYLSSLKGS